MQFAGSTEEDEDKETSTDFGNSSEAVQVHRAAFKVQEVIVSCCVPTRAEAEQYSGGCRC